MNVMRKIITEVNFLTFAVRRTKKQNALHNKLGKIFIHFCKIQAVAKDSENNLNNFI